MAIPLVPIAGSEPIHGDFRAVLENESLGLPPVVHRIAQHLAIRSAEELLDYAQSFPTAIGSELGWTAEEVGAAATRLADLLRQHLGVDALQRPPQIRRAYGALDPRFLKRSE